MTEQLNLLVREYIAQRLILLAMYVAPKPFAHKLGLAILAAEFKIEDFK